MKTSTLTCLALASTATCEITCGIASGYDKGEKAYFFSGDGSLSSFDACSAKCQGDSKCQSFAFDSSQCLLYASPLDSNFRQQSNSPFLFYDRNCVDVKATSSFTTDLPPATAPAAGGAAATPPASGASPTPGNGGSSGGSGGGNGGSGGGNGGGDSGESGSAPTAQAVSATSTLPGSGGAPGGQLGASNTASSGFSTATSTGTGESGSSPTGTSSSGSGSGSGSDSGSDSSSSSTASSSSSGSSQSGTTTSGAAATTAETIRMLVLGSVCVLATFV